MIPTELDPLRLNVAIFATQAVPLQGQWLLADLDRLAEFNSSQQFNAHKVTWQARGEHRVLHGGKNETWLHVSANTSLELECQRCLSALIFPLEISKSFLFVHGESMAAELDEAIEDDVLSLTSELNLRDLVEDELLLSLPLVPRHTTCTTPLPALAQTPIVEDEKPNPFAMLAALKRGDLQG
jgi:uncharacterized protein